MTIDSQYYKSRDKNDTAPKIAGIRYAPLSTPLLNRCETFSLVWHIFSIPTFLTIFMLCCAIPLLWPFVIAYVVYAVKDDSPSNGGVVKRYSPISRNFFIWKLFGRYFPITLHKTVDLEPTHTYYPLDVQEYHLIAERYWPQNKYLRAIITTIEYFLPAFMKRSLSINEQEQPAERDPLLSPVSPSSPGSQPDKWINHDSRYSRGESSGSNGHASGSELNGNGNNGTTNRRPLSSASAGSTASDSTLLNGSLNSYANQIIGENDPQLSPTKLKPTGRKYIFGYHPHGIIGMGAFGGIATEGAGWSKLFPGIPVSLMTLTNNFRVPLYREYLMSLGVASVSKKSCKALLKRNQSICIVVGGAQESLLARPGVMDLVLLKRKGFVRLGMEVGNVALVPIMAFGENDLYDQVSNDKSSKLYRFQQFVKNFLGFTLPLMHARGVFNYDVGLVPYRRPVNIVVGSPIDLPYLPHPTDEEVSEYHDRYIAELQRIYNEHKDEYFIDWTEEGKGAPEFRMIE
ncbi:YALIA101S02e02520g1_1 [Yarrowia lipolytica]|jgi:hypothetical protein|uniref:diacylglycerol O-acyltransferase n=1 Tax=Yarrowia lipolytica TaxID=4952 RepID=A0A371BXW7_YARLL|nr:Diacylglycerol O-acyltransferase 1 [Yarrowia lipolytica]RDW22929.1 diacylglycerol acyltransferase-domain-containing protein [Yarrowia lipolytica]SEI31804.1 YALIA101S02e02520g1_1 [Yarrowia lipolytica]